MTKIVTYFPVVLLFCLTLFSSNSAHSQCICIGDLQAEIDAALSAACNVSENSISISLDVGVISGCQTTRSFSANLASGSCGSGTSAFPIDPETTACSGFGISIEDFGNACYVLLAAECGVTLIDTDGDAIPDLADPDDDNDGVEDENDPDPVNFSICGDIDEDTCDDCSLSMFQDPANDGVDTDGDGLCDDGDPTACDCNDDDAITEGFSFGSKTIFFGTFGDDIICGTSEKDLILAFSGDDCIDSGDGNDRVFAGFGDDIVSMGMGDDKAFGGPGNDDITGDGGEDKAHGGFGEDFCDAETTTRCEITPSE